VPLAGSRVVPGLRAGRGGTLDARDALDPLDLLEGRAAQ